MEAIAMQASLNRIEIWADVVYWYIDKAMPPGHTAGVVCYHNRIEGQSCPSPLGLFDADRLLNSVDNVHETLYADDKIVLPRPLPVASVVEAYPGVIESLFGVYRLTNTDVGFLDAIQDAHDGALVRALAILRDTGDMYAPAARIEALHDNFKAEMSDRLTVEVAASYLP